MSTPARQAPRTRRSATHIVIWGGSVLAHAGVVAAVALGFQASQETPPETPPIAIQIALAGTPATAQAPKPPAARPKSAKPVTRQRSQTPRTAPAHPAAPPAHPSPAPAPASPAPVAAATPAATAAPTAPAAQPVPAPVEAVTPPIGDAAYLHNPPPRYPAEAQDNGWSGRVVLRVHVDTAGHPVSVELRTTSGHIVLDKAALAAVRQWSFVPAKRGATPVEGWVDVPLDFHLD